MFLESRIPVEAWQQPGYEVARFATSTPVDVDALDYIVIHYAAGTLPGGAFVDWLRRVQRAYVLDPARGYSIGYGAAVWHDGIIGECRWWRHRHAANAVPTAQERDGDGVATDENRKAWTIIVVVDDQAPARPLQVEAVRELVADIRARAGRALPIIGHSDLEATGCPGDGIREQMRAGVFEPIPTIPPTRKAHDVSEFIVHHPAPPPTNGAPPSPEWVALRLVGVELQHIAGSLGSWVPALTAAADGSLSTGSTNGFLDLVNRSRVIGKAPDNAPEAVRNAWNARLAAQ